MRREQSQTQYEKKFFHVHAPFAISLTISWMTLVISSSGALSLGVNGFHWTNGVGVTIRKRIV
jgi:hypothetical protein